MALPLLRPAWAAPAGVQAACSTRAGGVSSPPFDSLNLGDHVGDDPVAVAANRARFAQALGARPVFLRQVHGTRAVVLDDCTPDGAEADACVSTTRGIACTMMVADCLPLLVCDSAGRAVGAAHAGWRGLAGVDAQGRVGAGVIESLFDAFAAVLGESLEATARKAQVWLGPCIGPTVFEVGQEVRAAFLEHDARAAHHFKPGPAGKWLADLPALARQRLDALGVAQVSGNDGGTDWCTVTQASRFFSHRRDRRSGRFAASVWLA